MIYSNNAECGEIFSLQSLFSTVQVEKILEIFGTYQNIATFAAEIYKIKQNIWKEHGDGSVRKIRSPLPN